jgi:hypothetical protein
MSAARIDHAAEARQIVEAFHAPSPEGAQMITEAQVHATLALVEQQRIANIIALSVPQQTVPASVRIPSWDEKLQLRPEIAEALGLS